MIDEFLFVFSYAAIKYVAKAIYGGIHVFFGGVSVNLHAVDTHCCFRLMSQFFYGQNTMHIRNQVEMPLNFLHFTFNVVP